MRGELNVLEEHLTDPTTQYKLLRGAGLGNLRYASVRRMSDSICRADVNRTYRRQHDKGPTPALPSAGPHP